MHAERPLARAIPFNEDHRAALEKGRDQLGELYQEWKAYRAKPEPTVKEGLKSRFDALVDQTSDYPTRIGQAS